MLQKTKFILIGLAAVLLISLGLNAYTLNSKQVLEKQMGELKKSHDSLSGELEDTRREKNSLQDKIASLSSEVDRISQERDELQKKAESIDKSRQELNSRLSSLSTQEAGSPREEGYWSGVLQSNKDLEMQLEKVRNELRNAKINNEELQREKAGLELEIQNLNRESQELQDTITYNKKMMDAIGQDLVREKNDKLRINGVLKSIKNENSLLRRQIKNLDSRKVSLERKMAETTTKNTELGRRLSEIDTLLQGKILEVGDFKKQLEILQATSPAAQGKFGAVELPAIVVRPQEGSAMSGAALEGKVITINKENNFVVIDLGEEIGIRSGDRFQVYRQGSSIASLEVIQTRKSVAACDIKEESSPIQVGDSVK